ncbi:MAG TPA: hypothetical protein VFG83_02940 [Kofleriaceae bacterium]|nr:hypothetical protein [Kofleriaceae bacterium]
MAKHPSDPLPVYKVGGIVRLDAADLEGWLARQRHRANVGRPHLVRVEPTALAG